MDIRGLRKELLNDALKYSERLAEKRNNDPALRKRLADALFPGSEESPYEMDSRERAIKAFRSAQPIGNRWLRPTRKAMN